MVILQVPLFFYLVVSASNLKFCSGGTLGKCTPMCVCVWGGGGGGGGGGEGGEGGGGRVERGENGNREGGRVLS